MDNDAAVIRRKIFSQDPTRLIQRYVVTGNFDAFKNEIMKRNNNGITETKILDLWHTICKKLGISSSLHKYI